MAISYEYPPDVPWFNLLLTGKKLRKRTQPFLKRMLGTVFYFGADILAFAPFMTARSMGRKYGAVYIDYDAPVAVRSLVTMEPNNTSGSSDDFFIYRASMQQLAKTMRQPVSGAFPPPPPASACVHHRQGNGNHFGAGGKMRAGTACFAAHCRTEPEIS